MPMNSGIHKTDELLEFSGLSEAEAARRLAIDGSNDLPSAKRRGLLHIALEVVQEPMFILLLACGSIYFVLGNIKQSAFAARIRFCCCGNYLFPGAQNGALPGSSA
jgi:P-type Ca2+ transporter type 2C